MTLRAGSGFGCESRKKAEKARSCSDTEVNRFSPKDFDDYHLLRFGSEAGSRWT
jgi:hypothetical protein